MKDFTKGPVSRHVLSVSTFIALTTAFQTLYFLADLYFVGRLGREAVAGVALAGNLAMIVLALTQALAVGATTHISQALGRKDREAAELIFNQAFVLSCLVGAVFGVAAWTTRGAYARGLAADLATANQGIAYLDWFVPALALQFTLVALGSALRGMGDMKIPTLFHVLGVALNIALAPILMFGWLGEWIGGAIGEFVAPEMGVAGAGLASFIAIAGGCGVFGLYFMRAASPIRFRPKTWAPRLDLWWRMLKVGLPVGGEFALMFVYLVFVYDLLRPFGASAQAGFGIGVRVMQALFLPSIAIGFAVAPVAGQNYGARLGDRVRETFGAGARLVTVVMVVVTALCHIAPHAMIGFFNSDPAVVATGGDYLRIVSWNCLASGLVFVSSSTFQGMGNTLPPLLCSLARLILFVVPSLWLSRRAGFHMSTVWVVSVGSVLAQAALNLTLLRRAMRDRLSFHPAPASGA